MLTLRLNQSMAASTLQLSIGSPKIRDVSGNALNGEWLDNSSVLSGDAIEGGDFAFTIHVLPGDANRDGFVSAADAELIPGTRNYTSTLYLMWGDIDGNNITNATDRDAILRRIGSRRIP